MAQQFVTVKVRPEDTLPGGRALGKAIGDGASTVLARRIGDGATGALRHLAEEIWWGNLVHALWNG